MFQEEDSIVVIMEGVFDGDVLNYLKQGYEYEKLKETLEDL